MKSLQGMISQYFIMNDITNIEFVSAGNKLKGHESPEGTTTDISSYASRKKEGIRITLDLLKENEKHSKWLTHFNAHKKKDDLADAFLQGNWFLKKKWKFYK